VFAADLVLLAGAFPVLLAVGYSSIAANVTNAVAATAGVLRGSLAYRDELAGPALASRQPREPSPTAASPATRSAPSQAATH